MAGIDRRSTIHSSLVDDFYHLLSNSRHRPLCIPTHWKHLHGFRLIFIPNHSLPFLALVAMIFSKVIADCSISPPPSNILQPPQWLEIINAPEVVELMKKAGPKEIKVPIFQLFPLQVATNAVNQFHSSTTKYTNVVRWYFSTHVCGWATYTGFFWASIPPNHLWTLQMCRLPAANSPTSW